MNVNTEAARMNAVRRYDVLDTPPDGAFDRITELAARLFGVPISIVSIVDSDRIWFKSHTGLDVEQVDREPGLCASAILQDEPWLVTDAAHDPRSMANPLVAGEMGLQFYAGAPLKTSDGYNLGTLCVIDTQPREVTAEELANLNDLAALVVDELELRLSARRTASLEVELRRRAEAVTTVLQEGLLPPVLPAIAGLEIAARYHAANSEVVGGDFYDVVPTDRGCVVVVGDAVGKGAAAANLTAIARWTLRTVFLSDWTPADAVARLNAVISNASAPRGRYVTIAVGDIRINDGGTSVTVALGGHPQPIILRNDGSTDIIGLPGPIIGWRPVVAVSEQSVEMKCGDSLIIFTDGMLDAIVGRGETDSALIAEVLTAHAGGSAETIAAGLDRAVVDNVSDDVAFLVVKVV